MLNDTEFLNEMLQIIHEDKEKRIAKLRTSIQKGMSDYRQELAKNKSICQKKKNPGVCLAKRNATTNNWYKPQFERLKQRMQVLQAKVDSKK